MNKEPKFKPGLGRYISDAEAIKIEKAFISTQGDPNAVRSQFYGSDMLHEMLNREDVVGIRFSYGLNEDGTPNIILAPLDTYGNVITKPPTGSGDSEGGYGPTCPGFCN